MWSDERNKEPRDKKKVNIPYLHTDKGPPEKQSRMEGNKGCEAHHLKSKQSMKAAIRGEVKK